MKNKIKTVDLKNLQSTIKRQLFAGDIIIKITPCSPRGIFFDIEYIDELENSIDRMNKIMDVLSIDKIATELNKF